MKKAVEEFLKALENDEALKSKIKEALENTTVDTEEAKTSLLVQVANENGYDVCVEDFSKQKADGQELDEDELDLVTGGGRGSEEGRCAFDYVCALAWNTCRWSNEYQVGINTCETSLM